MSRVRRRLSDTVADLTSRLRRRAASARQAVAPARQGTERPDRCRTSVSPPARPSPEGGLCGPGLSSFRSVLTLSRSQQSSLLRSSRSRIFPQPRRPLTFETIIPIAVPDVPAPARPRTATAPAARSIPITEPESFPPDAPALVADPPADFVARGGTGVPTDAFDPVGDPVVAPPPAAGAQRSGSSRRGDPATHATGLRPADLSTAGARGAG